MDIDIKNIEFAKAIDFINKKVIEYFERENESNNVSKISDDAVKSGLDNKIVYHAINIAVDLGLVRCTWHDEENKKNMKSLFATDKGIMLHLNGGVERQIIEKNSDLLLTRQLAKSTKNANTTSIIFAWVSGAFIGFGLLFQILGYIQQNKALKIQQEQSDIENKSLHKVLHDSICPLLNPGQKQENKQKNNECLSKFDTFSKTKRNDN